MSTVISAEFHYVWYDVGHKRARIAQSQVRGPTGSAVTLNPNLATSFGFRVYNVVYSKWSLEDNQKPPWRFLIPPIGPADPVRKETRTLIWRRLRGLFQVDSNKHEDLET